MKHLTAQFVKDLKLALDTRTRTLAARVREELANADQQHYRDLAGSVTDIADEALAHALVDVDTALIDQHITELRDMDAARARMQQGIYGICMDCGGEIGKGRLMAYPVAKRCLACQQRHERQHAGRPSPKL